MFRNVFQTQEMYEQAVLEGPHKYCPDSYKTQEMCERAV